MEVIEVTDKKAVNEFHLLPEKIYRNDPNWVPTLRLLLEKTFDSAHNAKFEQGDARRWILMNENECIGRIAAFYDTDYANGYVQPTGCCGFFECIDDISAATILFDTAKEWLAKNGMEAMDGPVNFGENFFYWGLLTDGFQPQTYGMQYHPPYYRKLFEQYGFKTFYEQYSYSLDITNPDLPERFWKIAAWVAKKPEYLYEHFTFRDQDRYIRDFMEIHKQAWSSHGNYKPVRFEQLKDMISTASLILDEEFIWFVYHNQDPVAFFMMIPDFNQVMKLLNTSRISIVKYLKMKSLLKKNVINRCRVIVLGVVPKYQGLGLESGIFWQLKQVMLRKPWYKDMEMSWVGDFNPKMNALFKSFGAKRTLTHQTLRYLFDREKTFVRAEIIQ